MTTLFNEPKLINVNELSVDDIILEVFENKATPIRVIASKLFISSSLDAMLDVSFKFLNEDIVRHLEMQTIMPASNVPEFFVEVSGKYFEESTVSVDI